MAQEQGVDIADVAESGTRVKVAVMVGTAASNKKKKKTQKLVNRFKNKDDKVGDYSTKFKLINKQAEDVVVNGIYHPGAILTRWIRQTNYGNILRGCAWRPWES